MTSGDNYGFSEGFDPSFRWGSIPENEEEIFKLSENEFINEITNCIMGFELEYDEDITTAIFNRYRGENLDFEDTDDLETSFMFSGNFQKMPIKKWWQFWI